MPRKSNDGKVEDEENDRCRGTPGRNEMPFAIYYALNDRHVLISGGPMLSVEQWEVCGVACYRACANSLHELHQLTMAFSPHSASFYGDAAQVKVTARRDATPEESERLRQLATQVSQLREVLVAIKKQSAAVLSSELYEDTSIEPTFLNHLKQLNHPNNLNHPNQPNHTTAPGSRQHTTPPDYTNTSTNMGPHWL